VREVKSFWVTVFFSSLAAMAIGGCVGFVAGALTGENGAYRRHCEEQREAIRQVLAGDAAFAQLEVSTTCDGGWVILHGRVRGGPDWVRLQELVTRALGQKRAEYALSYVTVE
jgi:hypothetical protein